MVKLKESSFLNADGIINTSGWLHELTQNFPQKYVDTLIKGINTTIELEQAHNTGLLLQSLSMAEILVDLQTDPETVIAAMLGIFVHADYISLDQITEQFGSLVAKLISGMLRMEVIHSTTHHHYANKDQHMDNIRKMLLAIIDDVRVVLIKLAEQTWLIRQAQHQADVNHQRLANDTMNIYAPLASRLGIGQLKWELEDLAFRLLQPDKYKELAKLLDSKRIEREDYVEKVKTELRSILESAGLKNFDLAGRAKHIYSIYRKMQRKDVDYTQIYDVIAVRVLTRTIEECYAGLSCVHSLWQPIHSEFDDYISNPKTNGYRSIHTAVIGPDHKNIEVQLRTYQMHEESELGVAAHWKYKEGASNEMHFEKKIAWLRQVIEWQRDLVKQDASDNQLDTHSLFDDRVYVFTPAGEVLDLPKGATPLDFAYHIHSQIGHRCRGAKINGNIVPLTYTLHTGECVEILTSKQPNPGRDWILPHLGYIHTTKARQRVAHWFKQFDHEKHVHEGRELLEKELKHQHVAPVDLARLAKKMHFKTVDELAAAIGRGDVKVTHAIQHAQVLTTSHTETPQETPVFQPVISAPLQENIPQGAIDVQGMSDLLTSTARCCKPIPGDQVIGYITRGRGISIHRKDCVNLRHIPNPERLIEVNWGKRTSNTYPVDLVIKAHDHNNLLKDISGLLSTEKVRLLRLDTLLQHQQVIVYLSLEISENELLQRVMEKLRHLPGVTLAERQGLG